MSFPAGQYLPASSEDHEERRGQDEESLQLPGKDHISPSFTQVKRWHKGGVLEKKMLSFMLS